MATALSLVKAGTSDSTGSLLDKEWDKYNYWAGAGPGGLGSYKRATSAARRPTTMPPLRFNDVACPYCKAQPGEICKKREGQSPHWERVVATRELQAKITAAAAQR